MEMETDRSLDTGSNVARVTKVRAGPLPLRQPVKNKLGGKANNKKQMRLAGWNVRTLLDRTGSKRPERQTAIVAKELARYNVDIAALSETRLALSDSMVDQDYTFYWSGRGEDERREAGVGFAIRNSIAKSMEQEPVAVSDRIITLRLPLQGGVWVTMVSIYAPTMTNTEDTKEEFYNQLRETIRMIPRTDKLIIAGDFNARVGDGAENWSGVLGHYGVGKCNSNGELLLALCSEYGLVITNTLFKHKLSHKTTWMHPRSKHWHLIDYVITRQSEQKDVVNTRAMRGADCSTDHNLVLSKVSFSVRKPVKKTGGKPWYNLNVAKLRCKSVCKDFQDTMSTALKRSNQGDLDVEGKWSMLKETALNTAKTVLGKPERRHQDWFDETDGELNRLMEMRNKAKARQLQINTRSTRANLVSARSQLQKYTRSLKSQWWERKAEELQHAAAENDMKAFYGGLREVYGPQKRGSAQLLALDGVTVLTDKKEKLERFAQHFDQLLNVQGSVDTAAFSMLEQRLLVKALDEPPKMEELVSAISATQENKASGCCGLPAEVWKYGGTALQERLLEIVGEIWSLETIPQDWKDANIIPLFKKGSRKECGNYRGISLLSVAGKIIARILLNRLNREITPTIVSESQCGFRSGRSTMDMVFSLRQVQEKCTEQNMPLYIVFIDFSKAFDTVPRDGLWAVLRKCGCTEKAINLVKAFHDGMQAKVTLGCDSSDGFAVSTGVKQGCVLAPTLFSIYLSAMLEVAFREFDRGVYIQTRHSADLFNVSHFKAKTRTTKHLVREMLYADDSALVAHSASDIQTLVNRFAQTAAKFSLKINIKKTECLYQPIKLLNPPPSPCEITIDQQPLTQTTDFTYLGSTISSNAKIEKELRNRMGRASAAFHKLKDRLWSNKHVTIRVKAKVYRAVVLTTLLYGAETWTIYRQQVKKLHAYMMRQLRDILGITWQDKIPNEVIFRRTGLPHMADILIQKNLRWIGHVHRMDEDRLPRRLLYSQLSEGTRNQGRPRLRLKDVVKRNMKWRNIDTKNWKTLAENRPVWRSEIQPKP